MPQIFFLSARGKGITQISSRYTENLFTSILSFIFRHRNASLESAYFGRPEFYDFLLDAMRVKLLLHYITLRLDTKLTTKPLLRDYCRITSA